MKIRCKECKTIYDNSEKYCPYCFARTNQVVRYRSNGEGNRIEGSEMKKRASTSFNYQKRATSKFKKTKSSTKDMTRNIVKVIVALFVLLFFLIDLFVG